MRFLGHRGGLDGLTQGQLSGNWVPTDTSRPTMHGRVKHRHELRSSCFYLKSSPEGVSAFVPLGLPSSLSPLGGADLHAAKATQLSVTGPNSNSTQGRGGEGRTINSQAAREKRLSSCRGNSTKQCGWPLLSRPQKGKEMQRPEGPRKLL